jgi:threonine synthase
LPQAFYYLYAFILLKKKISGNLFFSVPSGNLGNLISGLYAWKFGMPGSGFIAAMNINNPLANFFEGGSISRAAQANLSSKVAIRTLSPALDVNYPVNSERLSSFYDESPLVMKHMVYSQVIGDAELLHSMKKAWTEYGIKLDPHGALALAAAEKHADAFPEDSHTVVLATGHPSKYADLFFKATGVKLEPDQKLQELSKITQAIATIPANVDAVENAIASCVK